MTLATSKIGEEVRLVEVQGGRQIRKRLADLGLNLGMTVRVVHGLSYGPIIVAVKDSRLAIGRGMAEHIIVEKI
ncbi:MAG: ferrous iron transport protein A [Anaerolineae bacterium]|jgi:Fe2+ transport system protein FeoA|nr:ferrous iron transport protein A [Anaerolineae bacterium]